MSTTLERPVPQNIGRSKPSIKHIEVKPGLALCHTRIKKAPSGASEAELCAVCSLLANNTRWSR